MSLTKWNYLVTDENLLANTILTFRVQGAYEGRKIIMNRSDDTISRQAAIDAVYTASGTGTALKALKQLPSAQPETSILTVTVNPDSEEIERVAREIKDAPVMVLPSAQRWIPVSESLPEEDTDVLISYRYKEGEGDTSHVYIDITSYGDMYFGGRKVKGAKHWRQPFEYFTSNYEVIAWMPLPEPWKGE